MDHYLCSRQFVNAAVIVDPSSNLVITSACDEMSSWDIHLDGNEAHLLDSGEGPKFLDVANKSSLNFNLNGSPWDLEASRNRVSCLNPWQWSQQHSSSPMSCSWNPLRHAAMVAIEYSASRDRHLYPTMEKAGEKCCKLDLDAAAVVRSLVKRQKTNLSDVSYLIHYQGISISIFHAERYLSCLASTLLSVLRLL